MKRFWRGSTASRAVLTFLALAAPLPAQTAVVAVAEENFRAEPRGRILAELFEGTALSLGEERGSWRQATVEGWIWGRSVREQRSGDLDLIVNAEGENLRATPNGERIGRALGGMRLDRLERQGDWVRVRRTGWIWVPSLAQVEGERAERPAGGAGEEALPTGSPSTTPSPPSTAPSPSEAALRAGSREFVAVADAVTLLDNPGGDTVAGLRPGARVEVVAREGGWSRVRIEGWVFSGGLAPADDASGGILSGLSRDSLQADPGRYRGRIIEWAVQFIALQEAERFRTDFVEGEPFMLARGPGEDPGFVYVAVAPDRLAEVQKLSPLRRIRIVARVRTVRSSLTGAPVLDLLEITSR